jgi:hypothetical protein
MLALVLSLALSGAAPVTGRCYGHGVPELCTFSFRELSRRRSFDPALAERGVVSRPSDPVVVGPLAAAEIVAVVDQDLHRLRYCYERRLRLRPDLTGTVTVMFVVSGIGTVANARIGSSTTNDPALEDCLAIPFRGMQFPAPAGGHRVVVSYPLLFSPG